MSTKHLATGSELPEKVDGKWRLYSMEYCPYAHRVRLVLDVKNVPYETVNCNLINKPEWLYTIHPEAKVPALDTGEKIVVESLDICNFIDGEYQSPPLYPSDPVQRKEQEDLIKKMDGLITIFTKIILEKETKTLQEWLDEANPLLHLFEDALDKSGSFFGGDHPNMVDYLLWPWGERLGTVPLVLGGALPIGDDDFRKLKAWRKYMGARPEVRKIYTGPKKFLQVVHFKTKGVEPDYDNLK